MYAVFKETQTVLSDYFFADNVFQLSKLMTIILLDVHIIHFKEIANIPFLWFTISAII